MNYLDNIQFLRKNFPRVLEQLSAGQDSSHFSVQIVSTKNDMQTILVERDGKKGYLHSLYNPIREAETFIESYEKEISAQTHVLFFGVGLGYHIEYFCKKHPEKKITIYEPSPVIAKSFLETRSLQDYQKVLSDFIVSSNDSIYRLLTRVVEYTQGNVFVLTLPSYERMFAQEFHNFSRIFLQVVKDQRTKLATNYSFQKRWTLNSLLNFKKTLETPKLFDEKIRKTFKDRPAIIVSAGPSLEEELDGLRYIKENNLAYLFAVGSAINPLLKNEIYPDAACTYDPQATNHLVFEQVIEKNITTIPLIYGSSVGFETLQKYPGPLVHFITNQDKVAAYYLRDAIDSVEVINDAPSIAVITFQFLSKLGCNPIILVGQNLAFRGSKSYAEGSKRSGIRTDVDTEKLKKAIEVESVDGEIILTTDGFKNMREQLELYISRYPEIQVINTTKGGAKIRGTVYEHLDDVIQKRLTVPIDKIEWWNAVDAPYNLRDVQKNKQTMEKELKNLEELVHSLAKNLRDLEHYAKRRSTEKLNKLFIIFDKLTKKLRRNDFYNVFLLPMNRVQLGLFEKEIEKIKFIADPVAKAEAVVESFGRYLQGCHEDLQKIAPLVLNMHQEIESCLEKLQCQE